jgi:molecular chaperone HtpG
MIKIRLPREFQKKLSNSQEWEGIVLNAVSLLGEILIDNKLYFFEEYTDHGVKHIEGVLESTFNLIPEETLENILSEKDIAIYVLSVLLHDIAMHLSLDGFNQLLAGEYDDVRVIEFDKYTWSQLWDDFINEARKFNGKQLQSIFGDQNVIIRNPTLLKKGEINENDKKLIGEFLRRHHPRLAHEIALKGFPGVNASIPFAERLDTYDKHLVGLIARSHGLDLRRCINYIELFYGKNTRRHINGIHIVYMFVLLRISDYLQIDRSRTSATILKLKTFASPYSMREHETHLAINYVDTKYQNDPERIFVQASPLESSMYLKIRQLLENIQHELDISWAVLGEIYGNINDRPGIKFRRIISNLNEESFANLQPYVADTFYFKANDEVVKLLIAPLYGNDPTYGIRELLQNAVDSCKEREQIANEANDSYNGEIELRISKTENDDCYFTITDNGMGMTIEIIKNYFLAAGASYRNNIDWRKTFIDIDGNSSIERSGQFGVGVLAAFLIGPSIYVETRSIKSDEGYKFTADLKSTQINVSKDKSLNYGTTIKIKIDPEKILFFEAKSTKYYAEPDYNKYNWAEWYMLPRPTIKYFYFNEEIKSPILRGPDLNTSHKEWRAISSRGYNKILWTYDDRYGRNHRDFICNGIVIEDAFNSPYINLEPFIDPKLAIFDNNAVLPLTLDRDELSDEVSFRSELIEDICKDFLAYILLYEPTSFVSNNLIKLGYQKFNYPGTKGFELDNYLISKKGFLIQSNYTFEKIKDSLLIDLKSESLHKKVNTIDLNIGNAFFNYEVAKKYSIQDFNNEFWNSSYYTPDTRRYIRDRIHNARIYMKSSKYKDLFEGDKKRVPVWVAKGKIVEEEKHDIKTIKFGTPRVRLIPEQFLKDFQKEIIIIKERTLPKLHFKEDIINNVLERFLGENVVIPYSIQDRMKYYPLAFKELETYMSKHKEKFVLPSS